MGKHELVETYDVLGISGESGRADEVDTPLFVRSLEEAQNSKPDVDWGKLLHRYDSGRPARRLEGNPHFQTVTEEAQKYDQRNGGENIDPVKRQASIAWWAERARREAEGLVKAPKIPAEPTEKLRVHEVTPTQPAPDAPVSEKIMAAIRQGAESRVYPHVT